MKEEIQEEMNQLRSELRRRQNQITMFPTPMDERSRLKFSGDKWENSIEFLARVEKEIEKIGSAINHDEKIDFVTRYLKESASQWYCTADRKPKTLYESVSYTHLDVYKRQSRVRKDIKESHKQINDNLNDPLTTITREQNDNRKQIPVNLEK